MSFSCCNMLNEWFDLYGCEHKTKYDPVPEGAVLVFHGGNEQLFGNGPVNAQRMNRQMENSPWCIFVNIGDESSEFPVDLLHHPNMKLWVQTPLPAIKADRYPIEGYPAGTKRTHAEKELDIFFAGQCTHIRRVECCAAVRKILETRSGLCIPTEGFGQGMPQAEYLSIMSRSRIVPCPSGPSSPDSFRVWESLECGAVPILDSRSLRDSTVGFWNTVLGDHPLPMIDRWENLPKKVDEILSNFGKISRCVEYWWVTKKRTMKDWLAKDLMALRAL
jgi:hypothetical protein